MTKRVKVKRMERNLKIYLQIQVVKLQALANCMTSVMTTSCNLLTPTVFDNLQCETMHVVVGGEGLASFPGSSLLRGRPGNMTMALCNITSFLGLCTRAWV